MRNCVHCPVLIEDDQIVCYRCGTVQVEDPDRERLENGEVKLDDYLSDIEQKLELLEKERDNIAGEVRNVLIIRSSLLGTSFAIIFMALYFLLGMLGEVDGACFGLIFVASVVLTLLISVFFASDLLEKYSRQRLYSGNMAHIHHVYEEERKWATSSKITDEYGRP